jgi:hypothetical protein
MQAALTHTTLAKKAQKHIVRPLMIAGFIVLLGLIDVLSMFLPTIGQLGVYVWLVGWLIPIILVIRPTIAVLRASYVQSQFIWLVVLCMWFGMYAYHVVSPLTSGGESPQEIGCALHHLSQPNGGYHQTCLFGYPARQYYLPALPSVWFGKQLTTLNLGNSLYLLLGLIVSLVGVWHYWQHRPTVWWVMTCLILILPQFYFFNHFFFFLFEQSIFPFAFALMGVGWWLLFLAKKDLSYLAMVCLLTYQSTFLYTPGLSLYVLGIVALGFGWFHYWLQHPFKHKPLMHIVASCLILGVLITGLSVSLLSRRDLKIAGSESTNPLTTLTTLRSAWALLLKPNVEKAYFSSPLQLGFWAVLSWLILYKRSWWSVGLASWIIGVITLSVVAKGYAYYGIDFRLHRSMVAMPIVSIALLHILITSSLSLRRWWRWFVILVLLGFGCWQYIHYAKQRTTIEVNYLLAQQLQQQIVLSPQITSLPVLLIDEQKDYIPINDWLRYFNPQVRVDVQATTTDCSTSVANYQIVVLAEDHACQTTLKGQGWQELPSPRHGGEAHSSLVHPQALDLIHQ